MAYRAVVDMQFNPILNQAPDVATWAAAGLSQGQALAEMRDIYKIAEKESGVAMDFSDVPNILCEPNECRRVKFGEGKRRALCGTWMMSRPALHFVGIRGDEYVSARRVWDPLNFFHIGWDLRVQREIELGDTIVFAEGDRHQVPTRHS
jgi:hypothetical protein